MAVYLWSIYHIGGIVAGYGMRYGASFVVHLILKVGSIPESSVMPCNRLRPPNVPLLRALWSLLVGIWGILKGSCGPGIEMTRSYEQKTGRPPAILGAQKPT